MPTLSEAGPCISRAETSQNSVIKTIWKKSAIFLAVNATHFRMEDREASTRHRSMAPLRGEQTDCRGRTDDLESDDHPMTVGLASFFEVVA